MALVSVPQWVEQSAAVMVDLDGTMVDTLGDFAKAVELMLQDLKLPAIDAALIENMVGKGSEHLLQSVLTHVLDKAGVESAAAQASALLRAVGTGYLGFAQAETGLFRTAFVFGQHEVQVPPDPARTAAMGLNPFELLGAALDAMVATGVLPAERRPQAEYLAWSAVHGMALLIIDGPLRGTPATARRALGERLLQMVENGL